jgi:PAS domain S-box-containing protein
MTPSRRRVMLVEDSPTQAERLRSLLDRAGMEVTHVASAEDALARLESVRPELVLLDYHLPGMNGDEFCREIRLNVNTRAIPVLMLTIESGDAAEARGLESGADDYLEKSADPDVLVARVRGLLRHSEGAAHILGAEGAFSRPRLLLVSEMPQYLRALTAELTGENYDIQSAAGDAEVANRLRSAAFDCVLVDCGACPSTAAGQARIAALRGSAGGAPALLLLVNQEKKQDMMAWLEAGADDYMAKSVDPALLRARVRALLRRKALLDENRRIAEELAEKQLQAVRAAMADRLEAANRELQDANRKLQQALEVTKAITDNAGEALFLLDRQGAIEFVNPAATRIFGYEPSEILHRPLHATLHHHHADGREFPVSDCAAMQAFARGGGYAAHDDVFFRKDGSPVDVAYSMSPIAAEGAFTGAVAVVHDVSERKRAEERLRHAQELERIGLLAGGIAHDFNNLLVGVIGNASMAADLLPHGHPAADMLGGIIRSGEMAAHLTRQLLAYAGKGRFLLQAVNLSALAREARLIIERSISPKITFSYQLTDDLPPVESDPAQIQQVLMNLVLNASEAIGDNPGVIALTTGVEELTSGRIERELATWPIEPGRFVFLEVRDTGMGMDAETKARIFEPFFTTKFHGRGLGLAAVAGIVRGHKGAIAVDSAPGAGATFRVWLPAASAALESPAKPAMLAADELRGRGTILVVDDEAFVREVARKALERRGYDVVTAVNGLAAIEALREHRDRVRAVVLDLSMPGLSGQETLPRLREVKPDVDVILSSGYSEAEALRLFEGSRVSAFLQKPYTVHDLARKLKDVLAP